MKTSNVIVWGSVAGILGICIVLLIGIKFSLNDHFRPDDVPFQKADMGLKKITITGFTGIDMKGNWQARIIQGNREQIQVEGPEDLLAVLSVNRHGNSIAMHMAKQMNDKRKLHLAMTMPMLEALQIKGVADIEISGFQPDRLFIHAEGVSSVRGEKGRAGELIFRGKGVSNLDLYGFPTIRAELDCQGVVNIDLTMAGGELTGRLMGAGRVRYKGEISRESIRKKGPCSVSRI